MHLRAVKIRGFKSFPDPVEVRLEPGVAVVVGPNGSGKSNIADAIVWAAGSLSPSELRAEKPEDVLYVGSKDKPAAQTIASEMFDLPEPFGPTTTATPGSRRTSTGSGNDLKPRILTARRYRA